MGHYRARECLPVQGIGEPQSCKTSTRPENHSLHHRSKWLNPAQGQGSREIFGVEVHIILLQSVLQLLFGSAPVATPVAGLQGVDDRPIRGFPRFVMHRMLPNWTTSKTKPAITGSGVGMGSSLSARSVKRLRRAACAEQ